jgi:hypothetical protein
LIGNRARNKEPDQRTADKRADNAAHQAQSAKERIDHTGGTFLAGAVFHDAAWHTYRTSQGAVSALTNPEMCGRKFGSTQETLYRNAPAFSDMQNEVAFEVRRRFSTAVL